MNMWRAFLLVALATACTRRPAPVAPVPAPAAPPSASWLEIPKGQGAGDPLSVWVRELTSTRLSRVPKLTWTCTRSPLGLLLQTPVLGFRCEDIRKSHPELSLNCVAESLLRIDRTECSSETIPPLALQQIWLPVGSGLYHGLDRDGLLIPMAEKDPSGRLPSFKVVDKIQGALDLPAPLTWLKQGAATGPVALALTVAADDKDSLSALWNLLRASKEALDLPLFLDPLGQPPPDVPAGSSVPLFRVQSSVTGSPYTEACAYIGRWLQARALTKGLDPSTARVRDLRCDFAWGADLVPGRSLVLNRLPLPLFSPAKGIFVLKSEEESLSPAVLRAFLNGP